ncbi:MAG: metallophosphoesterase [Myxococcota bacterium]
MAQNESRGTSTGPGEPVEQGGGGWSFVVLPDTQYYVAGHPEIFEAQARWIAERAEALGIRFVLHEGDVTDDNSRAQWALARRAMARLDGRVPYVLVPGNHDYGEGGTGDTRACGLSDAFWDAGIEARPSFGGSFEPGRLENTFHVFGSDPEDAWLVLALELAPRDAVVDWANGVLAEHATMPALVLTHAYLYADGTRYDGENRPDQRWSARTYGFAEADSANEGEALWQKLVRPHPNVRLVLCGHVPQEGARRTSERPDGTFVHEVLANYQQLPSGGEGFLRIVRVEPTEGQLHVSTYSPWLDEEKRDDANRFTLPL